VDLASHNLSMRILLRLGLILVLALLVGADNLSEVFRIRQVDVGNGIVLYGRNNLGSDITVNVWLTRAENVVATPEAPLITPIEGGREVKLMEIRQRRSADAWNVRYDSHWAHGNIRARHDDSVVYSLPYLSGARHRIIQGYFGTFSHQGDDAYCLDFDFDEGTPVHCCREGVVVAVQDVYGPGRATADFREKANYVRVRHSDLTIAEYTHLTRGGVLVSPGQAVERGTLLGYSGSSGYASGPHLHFFVYRASDGHHRQSLPVRFRVAGQSGGVELQQGQSYAAP